MARAGSTTVPRRLQGTTPQPPSSRARLDLRLGPRRGSLSLARVDRGASSIRAPASAGDLTTEASSGSGAFAATAPPAGAAWAVGAGLYPSHKATPWHAPAGSPPARRAGALPAMGLIAAAPAAQGVDAGTTPAPAAPPSTSPTSGPWHDAVLAAIAPAPVVLPAHRQRPDDLADPGAARAARRRDRLSLTTTARCRRRWSDAHLQIGCGRWGSGVALRAVDRGPAAGRTR
jgi:hypothetical protein